MKYRVPVTRRARWALSRAVRATKAVWENRGTYREWRSYGLAPDDIYEVGSPSFAEWLGVEWPGYRFTLYPQWCYGYDRYDWVLELARLWWYIASGEEANDACREADYQLYCNAF
jgi:hypothetical protein